MFQHFHYKEINFIFLFFLVILFLMGIPQAFARAQHNEWSTPLNFSQQPETYSNVPDMICDPYQNLHVFWTERLEQRDGIPQSALFYKNDLDGVWSKPYDLLVDAGFDEVHAANTPDNLIHLVWTNWYHELTYIRGTLNAASQISQWTRPVVLEGEVYNTNVSVDKNGILYVIYTTEDPSSLINGIYYISSPDSGNSWSISKTILEINTPIPSTTSAQLIIDDRGRFHVVYSVRSYDYGDYSVLGYMRSIDAGENWESPIKFPSATTFQGVNMLAEYSFGDDEIHLTYDIPERLHQWSYDGGETWSQPIPIVNGAELGAAFGGYNQLVKDSSGKLHVVMASAAGVFYSTWEGAIWSEAELIDKPIFDPHGQIMTLCQGNRLSVLYSGNDVKSEVWYSEKWLNLLSIPQSTIPTPSPTPISIPTSSENIGFIETPTPTEMLVHPPVFVRDQSMLPPLILPASLVIFVITVALFYRIKNPR